MIPKVLHFVWVGDGKEKDYLDSWQKINPGWKIQEWDEDTATKATGMNVENVRNPWIKSMILRLAILYKFGGVYCDYDLKCIKSCDEVVKQGSPLFLVDNVSDFIKNRNHAPDSKIRWSFMGFTSNHPFLKEVLDYINSKSPVDDKPSAHLSRRAYQSIGKLFNDSQYTGEALILPCKTITRYRGSSYPLTIAFHCTPSKYPWRNGFQRSLVGVEIWLYKNPVAERLMMSFIGGFILAFITMVVTDAVRKSPKYKLNK